ncbi:MAG: hypothetical protein SH850_09615 [Planctomycetaceae bacterium]|nr:hypothetical protein [Planctomycetaceae bacterium]
MLWQRGFTAVSAVVLCLVINGSVLAEDDREVVTAERLMERYRQPVDEIGFDKTPLPEAIRQIAERYQIPVVIDDSVSKLSPMPSLSLTVRNITVRQLLDVVAACTWTTMWVDPPHYDRNTSLRVLWVTRSRARQLADHVHWKTVAVQRSERVVAALGEPTIFEFADTSLEDALSFLRDFHQMQVEYAGPPMLLKSPITLEGQFISLRAGLHQLLPPLKLGYVIENGALRIVTAEQALKVPTTRVYAVPHWVGGDIDVEQLEAAIVHAFGEKAPNPRPTVAWLKNCVVVTAPEPQQARIEEYITQLRTTEQLLAPPDSLPHAPGQLPMK